MDPRERTYCPVGYGDDSSDGRDGDWRDEPSPAGLISQENARIASQEKFAKEMRDKLMSYMLNEGNVDWQTAKIGM
jgi:hypothetical protein